MGANYRWLLLATAIGAGAVLVAALLTAMTGFPVGMRAPGRMFWIGVAVLLATALRLGRMVLKRDTITPLEFATTLAGIAVIGCFLQAMSQLKTIIPAVVPFWADDWLLAFDVATIGHPENISRLLQPAVPAIGLTYVLWHFVNLGGIAWVLHWQSENRGRLVVAYMLTWTIGMALAFAFSSKGPIFTGAFDPALSDEAARTTAASLWESHTLRLARVGHGISAFPSMHVAIATWFLFVLRERGLQLSGYLFLGTIYIGSIALGWHYSLDGVAGVLAAVLGYRLAPRLIDFHLPSARRMKAA